MASFIVHSKHFVVDFKPSVELGYNIAKIIIRQSIQVFASDWNRSLNSGLRSFRVTRNP